MDLLYTFTDIRYWSEFFSTTTLTFIYDIEVEVIDLEISC